MENPWETDLHSIWEKAKDPIMVVGFEKSSTWHYPWWCKDCLWWSPLLIWDPGSSHGWSRARSFPIPGHGGHWLGQLELKTAPLAHGRSNQGSAFFSIWKSDGALGEGNHTSCTACICGLKILKLFFVVLFEQLLRECFSAVGSSCDSMARVDAGTQHQLY